MPAHLTDEEQLEAIKRWWREYGLVVVAALALGIGGWYGWKFWQAHKQEGAEQASVLYMEMVNAASDVEGKPDDDTFDRITHYASTLKEKDPDSQYGRYSALILARLAVDEGDLDAAAKELSRVVDGAGKEPLGQIARLRLARVEMARGNSDHALKLLDVDQAGDFKSLYAEVRGDVLAARGDKKAARAAYQLALDSLSDTATNARPLIELKLAQVTPVDADANAGTGRGGDS